MIRTIESSKLLIVEGGDEEKFFRVLLHHMEIREQFQVIPVYSKDNFRKEIPLIVRLPGFFDTVESIAVIRDADTDATAAFKSIQDIFLKDGLRSPEATNLIEDGTPKTGIFIMPGNSSEGMLESLCLQTVAENPKLKCVDDFLRCVERCGDAPRNVHKARAQAFLAAMPKVVTSVGPGAFEKYWDFDSEKLKGIRDFLRNL